MKKRIISILLAMGMILGMVTLSVSAEGLTLYGGGSGTEADPYRISSLTHLNTLATAVNDGNDMTGIYFVLTEDIIGFANPIGYYKSETAEEEPDDEPRPVEEAVDSGITRAFKGYFDGADHTVTLNMSLSDREYVGLFGYVGAGAVVSNVNTAGTVTGTRYVGSVSGYNAKNSRINSCSNSAAINGTVYVGGVSGSNYGIMDDCANTGAVTGSSKYIGGVCGINYLTITNSSNTGIVTGVDASYVGGICGYNNNGSIINCFNQATVNNNKAGTGGVCGTNVKGTIENCYNSVSVSGRTIDTGSVCGNNDHGDISNCYYDNVVCLKDPIGVNTGTKDKVVGLPTAQMQALSGTTSIEGAWVSVSGKNTPLVDILNEYVDDSYEDLLEWIVFPKTYPRFKTEEDEPKMVRVSGDGGSTWKGYDSLEAALAAANPAALTGKPQMVEMLMDDPTVDADKYLDLAPDVTLNLCGKTLNVKGLHVTGKVIDQYTMLSGGNALEVYAEGTIRTASETGVILPRTVEATSKTQLDAMPVRSKTEPAAYKIYPIGLRIGSEFTPADLSPVTDAQGNAVYRVLSGGQHCAIICRVRLGEIPTAYAEEIMHGDGVKMGCRVFLKVYPRNAVGDITDITKATETMEVECEFTEETIAEYLADPVNIGPYAWWNGYDYVKECTYEQYIHSLPCGYEFVRIR